MNRLNVLLIIISFILMGLSSNLLLAGIPGKVPNNDPTNPTIFYINTKAHLDSVAVAVNDPNNWWKSSGKTFILEADIATFTNTIGTSASPFKGRFEGNGYRIHVSIYKPSNQMVGLFGQANDAVIKNLTVSGSVRGGWDVGGVMGWGVNTTITHCTNLANVEAKDADNVLIGFCGGIAGSTYGGITIEDCVNAGNVHSAYNVGGISGFSHDRTTILRCVNLGTVIGSWQWIGGIVGRAPGVVEHCFNGGYVYSGDGYVGGIVGRSDTNGTIKYCLNTGVVHTAQTQYSGSIAGYMPNTANVANNFYDKQMSVIGGINRNDIAGKATGRMTIDMVRNSLLSAMGANWNYWIFSNSYHYPTLDGAGNTLYIYGSNGRNDYNCNNEHWYHVAASVLKLQDGGSPIETTSNMRTNTFITTYHPSGNGLTWTEINNALSPRSSNPSNFEIWWEGRNFQGHATLIAKCGGFKKEVPIYYPVALPKSANSVESVSFSIGEVTPNIVTDDATIAIQTATEGNLNVSIYDLAGTKIANVADRYIDANTSLQVDLNNLSNLSTGSYMAVVSVGNEVVMRKFIKQ